ncbi:MAG: DsbC family protein [Gammaproteobacteria bacterium]
MKTGWSILPMSLFLAVSVAQENAELSKEELAATLAGVEASDIADSPLPGIYEVAIGSNVAYVTADGRYVLEGDLYDLSTNENVTETRRARARVNVLAGVDTADMIIFSPEPEDVKHTVTIFTDIDCGYCRQFHSEIAKVNELGIEVRYLFYPRTGPDTDSWFKADKVWCSGAEARNSALTLAKLGGQIPDESCDSSPVNDHYELGLLVGVRGTPTMYSESGVHVGGYLPPDELLKRLEEASD